jgi:hypothetical protein
MKTNGVGYGSITIAEEPITPPVPGAITSVADVAAAAEVFGEVPSLTLRKW